MSWAETWAHGKFKAELGHSAHQPTVNNPNYKSPPHPFPTLPPPSSLRLQPPPSSSLPHPSRPLLASTSLLLSHPSLYLGLGFCSGSGMTPRGRSFTKRGGAPPSPLLTRMVHGSGLSVARQPPLTARMARAVAGHASCGSFLSMARGHDTSPSPEADTWLSVQLPPPLLPARGGGSGANERGASVGAATRHPHCCGHLLVIPADVAISSRSSGGGGNSQVWWWRWQWPIVVVEAKAWWWWWWCR